MNGMRRRIVSVVAAGLALSSVSGCALARRGAMGMLSPVTGSLVASLQEQSDLELVRDGAPTYLLLLDGLVKSSPENVELLLAASEANMAYAAAFLVGSENERAGAMYAKARDYGVRALAGRKPFRRGMPEAIEDLERALAALRKPDARALYAAAMSWAGNIASRAGSIQAAGDLPKVTAMMRRVLELDPTCQQGGAHLFFGIYCAAQPRGAGQDLPKAKAHFEKAMELAGPDALLPRVVFAEYYARYTLDRELFEKTLRDVVARSTATPALRLTNEAARRRARGLLDRADDLF